jgi:predicted GNAT family N-acyltransferase
LSADCRLTVTVRPARDAEETEAARELRIAVFCDEQDVPRELEFDGKDDEATQIVAVDESSVIATCRLRYPPPEDTRDTHGMSGVCKLERMVVERRLRGRGVGARLLAGSEEEARRGGATTMVLHAQLAAQDFYASNGYVPEGETFMDADIEHIRMTKAL